MSGLKRTWTNPQVGGTPTANRSFGTTIRRMSGMREDTRHLQFPGNLALLMASICRILENVSWHNHASWIIISWLLWFYIWFLWYWSYIHPCHTWHDITIYLCLENPSTGSQANKDATNLHGSKTEIPRFGRPTWTQHTLEVQPPFLWVGFRTTFF